MRQVLAVLFALLSWPAYAQSIPFPGPGMAHVTGIGTPTTLGTGTATASGTTQAFALSGAIVGGDTVFVFVFTSQAGPTVVATMSDGTNTYTKATANTQATSITGELWYKVNATAVATPTITATMNGTANANATVMAVSQASGITAFDKTASAGGSGAAQTSLSSGATATLTTANELVIGAVGINTGVTVTESAGFFNLNSNGSPFTWRMSYEIVASTAAVTYAPSIPSTTCTWVSVVGTFR